MPSASRGSQRTFVAVKLLAWHPTQPMYHRRHSWKGRLDHDLNGTMTISKCVSRVLAQRSLCGGRPTWRQKRPGTDKTGRLLAKQRWWPDSSGLVGEGLACQALMKSRKQWSLGLEGHCESLTWVAFNTVQHVVGVFGRLSAVVDSLAAIAVEDRPQARQRVVVSPSSQGQRASSCTTSWSRSSEAHRSRCKQPNPDHPINNTP